MKHPEIKAVRRAAVHNSRRRKPRSPCLCIQCIIYIHLFQGNSYLLRVLFPSCYIFIRWPLSILSYMKSIKPPQLFLCTSTMLPFGIVVFAVSLIPGIDPLALLFSVRAAVYTTNTNCSEPKNTALFLKNRATVDG